MVHHGAVEPRPITLETLEEVLRTIPGESWLLVDGNGKVRFGVGPAGGVLDRDGRDETHIADYVHPDDLPQAMDNMAKVITTPGVPVHGRARVHHDDGTWHYYDVTTVNRLDDPKIGAVVVRIVEAVDEPVPAGDLISSLAEAVPTPILVVDHAGYVMFTNSAARTLLAEELDDVTARLADARAEGTSRLTFQLGERWIHARLAERAQGWLAMLDDVTAQMDAEDHLYRLAMTDQLTSVSNRAAFDTKLGQVLEVTGDAPVTVVFVDLDGFKRVNDQHGHAAGDRVLQVVAARLNAAVRPGDIVARIGGDEFGVICPGLTAEDAPVFADRLVEAVHPRIAVGNTRVLVDASAGTATSPPAPGDAAGLLAVADRAMYRDKTMTPWAPTVELGS
jgi:diguanylate cyclase (GGDEF)-like protein